MEHTGSITYEELDQAYRQVLEQSPAYLLVDGIHMIYDPQVFRHPAIVPIVQEYVQCDTTRFVYLVIPDEHDIFESVARFYTEMGCQHKLVAIPDRAVGIALIRALAG
jgi:hypothetical protein